LENTQARKAHEIPRTAKLYDRTSDKITLFEVERIAIWWQSLSMPPEWTMSTVFLSYSKKDYFFAELAQIKLSEAGITLWRDQGQLRAGRDWRQGFETRIADSLAVLAALSANSAESSYVTFEWAYALGKGKAIIPMKLNECIIRPKLGTIQYLDFTVSGALPWGSLIERIVPAHIASWRAIVAFLGITYYGDTLLNPFLEGGRMVSRPSHRSSECLP
jgi:hypothetical protein